MRKLGIAILAAAVASVTFVQAYVIDPQGLRWFGARATFHSYFDTADAQRAVAEAVRSWQSPLEDAVDYGRRLLPLVRQEVARRDSVAVA